MTVIQQTLVAASTVILALAARKVATEGLSPGVIIYGVFYLICLVSPYFPGVVAIYWTSVWKVTSLRAFIDRFLQDHRDRPDLWRNAEEKEKRLSALSRESADLISDSAATTQDGFSLLLNILFNMTAIVLVLDIYFLPALVTSAVAALSIMKRAASENARRSERQQECLRDHNRVLLRAWDNVLLGNDLHFRRWAERESAGFKNYRAGVSALAWYQQSLNLFVALGLFAPVLATIVFYTYRHHQDSAAIFALLVSLPRLVALLNFTHSLLALVLIAGGIKARWQNLAQSMRAEERDWRGPGLEKLTLRNSEGRVVLFGELGLIGRYRLSGPNGAGKSTALLRMKDRAGRQAIYVPASSELELDKLGPFSTGQRKREELAELLEAHDGPLFLDEWDGPLDGQVTAGLSEAIRQFSERNLVVEVSHRD